MIEGTSSLDCVTNYAGAQLINKMTTRAERTVNINAQYTDLFKSLRDWLNDDSTVVSLVAREIATKSEFSQSLRIGVFVLALYHYINCNDAAAASANDNQNRKITTSLPGAVGNAGDNNIVDLVDIPNLPGCFTALGGTVRFVCAKPTSTTSLWKLYIESFATAQDKCTTFVVRRPNT